MSYTKHEFQSGAKLYAKDLNEMDEQILKNEQDISKISEQITNLEEQIENSKDDNSTVEKIVTKAFTIIENEWESDISFRHIWYPFTANQDFTIKNVSFKAKVNNGWVDSSQNMYVELLQADASTVISVGSCKYEWVDNNTLCDFDIDLNGEVEKGKAYYLHIYCATRSFSYRMTGFDVTFTNEWLTTQCPTYVSNAGNAVFDQERNNPSMTLCCDMTIDAVVTEKVVEIPEIELFVSQEYTVNDEGFGETKFNNLLDAYESIPYSNSTKYVIYVADGTYTDMQTLYAGVDGTTYQGLVLGNHGRSNVIFQSISNDPAKCIIEWNGGTGYETELTNANIVNKCAFHVNGGVGWEIRGFKFIGKNLRYCFHSETNSKTTCLVENCIFEWNGKDSIDYNNHKAPVVGMGGTYCNSITFRKCQFFNSENTLAVQWHDNKPSFDEDFLTGAILRFEDCYFDGLDIMPRSTEANRNMPFSLELVRCGGLRKIYPNIGGSGTANYWRATVESCLIEDNKFKDCDSTTSFADLTDLKG